MTSDNQILLQQITRFLIVLNLKMIKASAEKAEEKK